MAYKRKTRKKKEQYHDMLTHEENKKFVQDYLERFDEEHSDGFLDFDYDLDCPEFDVDDFYITELAKEIFPEGANLDDHRAGFIIGYKRAIFDVNQNKNANSNF